MAEKALRVHRALVRRSFRQIAGGHQRVSLLFYNKLFELDPSVSDLFNGDIGEHRRRFMQMLALIVACVDEPVELRQLAQSLGRRHVHYGVQPGHYETVGKALLWALEIYLDSAFTPIVREAWQLVYAEFSALAIDDAYEDTMGK
jgi:hemoglobin-like flavoprotein